MNTPRLALLSLLCVSSAGCLSSEATPRLEMGTYATTGKVLFAGAIYDHRAPRTQTPPGEDPNASELREVRIPASEIRSVLADSLTKSRLFTSVVNPPAEFAGKTPDDMIGHAQKSSDYLLVGEVNQFHIKSLGFNYRGSVALPLDFLIGPIAFVTYAMSAGNHMVFTGGFVSCWTAEAVLSVSVSLVDANTGRVVLTERLEERAQMAYDGRDAFGALWEESDDWLDLGHRLGEVALHNAGVHLAARLAKQLPSLKPDDGDGHPTR